MLKYPDPCDFLESGILYFRTIWRKEGPEIYSRELMFLEPGTKGNTVILAKCECQFENWWENKWENKITFVIYNEYATSLSGYTGSGAKLTFVKVTDTDLIRVFKNWKCDSKGFSKDQSIQNLFNNLKNDYGLRREEHQRILTASSYSMLSDIALRVLKLWD